MHGCCLESQWQRKDLRIASDILLRILQGFLDGRSRLEPHASGKARLIGADTVHSIGMFLRQMSTAHHGEGVERVIGIVESIQICVLLLHGKALTVLGHIRQLVVIILLEELIGLTIARELLIVEVSVADRGEDHDTVVLHDTLVADHLCGCRLHHENRIGAHAVAVVEILRHTEDHDVVFLLFAERHVGALVRHFPGYRLHLLSIAGEDGDLTALGVKDRVTHEELPARGLLHPHGDGVELPSHEGFGVDRCEVVAVHDVGCMVGRNGLPVGDARCGMLVAARITAIGVAQGMADEDSQVGVEDLLAHDDRIVDLIDAEVHQVVVVLRVVVDDLVAVPVIVEDLVAEDGLDLLLRVLPVKPVGTDQKDIFFFTPALKHSSRMIGMDVFL